VASFFWFNRVILSAYNQKQNFRSTAEPREPGKKSNGALSFVVQQHTASNLHYDFRLEMDGVLKSWAVPRGPSMDPGDKRLAMKVEDLPYGYKDFEGTIPEGNYGAGNVIVWDNGTYDDSVHKTKKDSEPSLVNGLRKGRLKFSLHGKKLKGEFSLVKLKGNQDNAWLLIKKKDRFANGTDVLKKNTSVLSKATLEQLEKKPEKIYVEEKKKKKKLKGTTSDYDLKVGKVTLHLTNQAKIYFPDDNITKGDVVNYYREISSLILPYLKDRPQSLNRFPNGIKAPGFYQKDIDVEKSPGWLRTEKIYSTSNNEYIDYLLCNDKATLLYMANLGCIEINPWNSRISHVENPDWVVIDLDPEKIDFRHVVAVALEVKKLMDELEAACYCKTSGATGLHVYIPLAAKYDYGTAKTFAHVVAHTINRRLPDITSIERMPKRRQEKVYVDFLQNNRGQTLAAPYSLRPKPGATVSTPLEWKEVNEKLSPAGFTIKNILRRVERKGDLWKPVTGKGVNLDKIVRKFPREIT
jgi:bifunctional non-homologous end joining protein LigD